MFTYCPHGPTLNTQPVWYYCPHGPNNETPSFKRVFGERANSKPVTAAFPISEPRNLILARSLSLALYLLTHTKHADVQSPTQKIITLVCPFVRTLQNQLSQQRFFFILLITIPSLHVLHPLQKWNHVVSNLALSSSHLAYHVCLCCLVHIAPSSLIKTHLLCS